MLMHIHYKLSTLTVIMLNVSLITHMNVTTKYAYFNLRSSGWEDHCYWDTKLHAIVCQGQSMVASRCCNHSLFLLLLGIGEVYLVYPNNLHAELCVYIESLLFLCVISQMLSFVMPHMPRTNYLFRVYMIILALKIINYQH